MEPIEICESLMNLLKIYRLIGMLIIITDSFLIVPIYVCFAYTSRQRKLLRLFVLCFKRVRLKLTARSVNLQYPGTRRVARFLLVKTRGFGNVLPF